MTIPVHVATPTRPATEEPMRCDPAPGQSGAPRVAIRTLGCKVNAFESALIGESLVAKGMQAAREASPADLVIVNSCTVTAEADRQTRQEVRRAVRNNPDAVVVVTGCYAQMSPEACAEIPGVTAVVGNDRKLDVGNLLALMERRDRGGTEPVVRVGDVSEHVSLPDQLVSGIDGRTRAFLQIQQGCDQGCTFCIIHRARGPSRSLATTQILRQAERMIANGYRELVICGVDLGDYRGEFAARATLSGLVRAMAALPGDFRIRLSSIDPVHISDELIDMFCYEDKVCPHMHLSMQSGATMILKRMKRRYTREFMDQRITRLRERVPNLVMSADVMVGFPTESEAHFEQTVDAIDCYEIAYPHVFMYSARTGTPAARIPRQVDRAIKKQRADALRARGAAVRARVLHSRLSATSRVLIEDAVSSGGYRRARGGDYIPVYLDNGASVLPEPGQWLTVAHRGIMHDGLLAVPAAGD